MVEEVLVGDHSVGVLLLLFAFLHHRFELEPQTRNNDKAVEENERAQNEEGPRVAEQLVEQATQRRARCDAARRGDVAESDDTRESFLEDDRGGSEA